MKSESELHELFTKRGSFYNRAYSLSCLFMGYDIQKGGSGIKVRGNNRVFLDVFDAFGNQSFGYCNPDIIDAIKLQLDSTYANSCKLFFEEKPVELAEKLSTLTDNQLPCSFLTNGGAEAIDGAFKLARACTGKYNIISMVNCYHGKTLGGVAAAGRDEYHRLYGQAPGFLTVPFNNYKILESTIDENTAAIILEVVQGEGGVNVARHDYLQKVRKLCDRNNIVLIIDEIQTAFGRTGKFFAFQHYDITPDIVCIGKSFGGGMIPVAAVLATRKCWKAFEVCPVSFGSSLGGAPIATAVGLKTIDIASNSAFLESVHAMSCTVEAALKNLELQYKDFIIQCRGLGLFWGIEFQNEELAGLFTWRLYKRGVITMFTIYNNNVVRFQPPLIISPAELEDALGKVADTLQEIKQFYQHKEKKVHGPCFMLDHSYNITAQTLFELLLENNFSGKSAVFPEFLLSDDAIFTENNHDLDGTPLIWSDTVIIDKEEQSITFKNNNGDWTFFERVWTVSDHATLNGYSSLVCRIKWNCGTIVFEPFISMRIRWSLEHEIKTFFTTVGKQINERTRKIAYEH